jgi:acyl carrier protein
LIAVSNPFVARRISYKHTDKLSEISKRGLMGACLVFVGSREIGGTMDTRAVGFDVTKLPALIAKYLGIDDERVTDETHFRDDFDLDSLDQLELLILVEEFSGAEFSNAAVEQIETVGDLIRYLEINCLLGELYSQTLRRSAA